jgi:hypothetical protein
VERKGGKTVFLGSIDEYQDVFLPTEQKEIGV